MPKKVLEDLLFVNFTFDTSTHESCKHGVDMVCHNNHGVSIENNLVSIAWAGSVKQQLSFVNFDVTDLQVRLTQFIVRVSSELLQHEETVCKNANCDLLTETENIHL